MNTFQINQDVEKVAADYTNGRKGKIEEINGDRCRVRWALGGYKNGLRTWCNYKTLKATAPGNAF